MQEKKFNFVYLITNLTNGKQYVGDHSTENLEEDKYYLGSGRLLSKKIQEYKKQNFKREILEFFSTKQKAFDAQEQYIIKYNTLVPNGYNISPKGGHNAFGCWNEESKSKMKKSLSISLTGRKFSEEHKKNLSLARKNKTYEEFYGKEKSDIIKEKKRNKNFSIETRKKLSDSRIGEKNNMFNKTLYGVWLQKKGEEYANKRMQEYKNKMSEVLSGKPHNIKKVICPNCGLTGGGGNMSRYHFNNCKHKI